MFEPQVVDGQIVGRNIQVGRGVVIERGVHIEAQRVILGDYCYIGRETRILVPEFRLGHYSKLNAFSFGHGSKPLQIGRNCWIGGNVVLDSIGGLDIDDGVGIGAHSQIWTHIQFGDIVEGCRWHSQKYMHIGKDAWFVGCCHVSPVTVGERSMALLGSTITHDMEPNHVYGGVPAVDLTDKVGPQFEERTIAEKIIALSMLVSEFMGEHPEYRGLLQVVDERDYDDGIDWSPITRFCPARRTYRRTYSEAEVAFLKRYTPLIKFTADGEAPFIERQDWLKEAMFA